MDHFSKYGLSDSDEEETPVSDIKKLRLSSVAPQAYPPGPKEVRRLMEFKVSPQLFKKMLKLCYISSINFQICYVLCLNLFH